MDNYFILISGSALRDFNENFTEKTGKDVDYINFFRQFIPIQHSTWYDSNLKRYVEVFTVNDGDRELFYYSDIALIVKLDYDYNQAFD